MSLACPFGVIWTSTPLAVASTPADFNVPRRSAMFQISASFFLWLMLMRSPVSTSMIVES